MTNSTAKPGPADTAKIMDLSTAYWDAQVLLTASRLGIFAAIADGELTTDQVAEACKLKLRHTGLFLKALVAIGLLIETDGCYSNTATTLSVLVPGGKMYLGNTIKYSDDLYDTWGKLEQALREGKSQLPAIEYLGKDQERTRHFVYGMHDRALGDGNVLVELVDLSDCKHLLDVGGGPGTYSALFARRYPDLRSQVLDLPPIVAISSEIIRDMGVAERVSVLPGDYYRTEFPKHNDAVLISGVFHRETEAMCRELIGRAVECLQPGGKLIISDVFTDASGAAPKMAALFGINMMLTAPDGGVHADAHVESWMRDAGLQQTSIQAFPPPMPHRVIMGSLQT